MRLLCWLGIHNWKVVKEPYHVLGYGEALGLKPKFAYDAGCLAECYTSDKRYTDLICRNCEKVSFQYDLGLQKAKEAEEKAKEARRLQAQEEKRLADLAAKYKAMQKKAGG